MSTIGPSALVDIEARGTGEFVVGDPVAGQDNGVALDDPAGSGVEVFEFDRCHGRLADDPGEPGASGHLTRATAYGRQIEHTVGLGESELACHQGCFATGMP